MAEEKWYPRVHHSRYGTDPGDWRDRGYKDACNLERDYTKHWNASTLIEHGLTDVNNKSWHGESDYQRTAEAGSDSNYHTSIRTLVDENYRGFCVWEYVANPFKRNVIRTGCWLYNETTFFGTPAGRASAFVHEPWHGWLNLNLYKAPHRPGTGDERSGNCKATGTEACDYFYWHGVKEFKFGHLSQFTRDGRRFHSPFQVQAEYLCDLAQFAESWVPAMMRMDAEQITDHISSNRFINGPGIKCNSPRPWSLN